jgi:hypothetical protein
MACKKYRTSSVESSTISDVYASAAAPCQIPDKNTFGYPQISSRNFEQSGSWCGIPLFACVDLDVQVVNPEILGGSQKVFVDSETAL